MRPRRYLCTFTMCNRCHKLNETQRYANEIRAVCLKIFINFNEFLVLAYLNWQRIQWLNMWGYFLYHSKEEIIFIREIHFQHG